MEANEKKPIIIHIENEDTWNDLNDTRDAFVHILKNNFNLEVFIYRHDWYFRENLEKLKNFFSRQQVILIIVDQDGECEQQDTVIPFVRENLSMNVPIAVLLNELYEKPFKGEIEKLTYSFYKASEPLINLIKKLTENWILAHNWFDERTERDRTSLMFKLENSYLTNYPENEDDSGDFGTKDHNHMLIAQALRTRLYVGPIVQEEFHNTIPQVASPNFSKVKSSIYEKELEKVKNLSKYKREELWQRMRDTLDGGVSCGKKVKGFAIDPITLEYLITSREGQHYGAGALLFYRIYEIDNLKERYFKGVEADDDVCKARIITGLIFKVSNFNTPILHIAEVTRKHADTEALKRVINFLTEQQMFIPTHSNGQSF